MQCGSRKAGVTAMFLSELILGILTHRSSGCGILRGQVEMSDVRDKNLRVVSMDQEGIVGGERLAEKRAQVDPGIPR